MKVLFTYDYGHEAREAIRALGYEVDYIHEKAITSYEGIEQVDIIACYKAFDEIDMERFQNLKLILLSSIGIDQLPKDKVKKMGLTVCNNKGGYSIPIGEWIVMKSLELMKNSRAMYENQRVGRWHMDTTAEELYKKKVLFLGTGTIAHEAAKRLQGFDVQIVGLNTSGTEKAFFDQCYPMEEVKTHLKDSDVVVITLPYTQKTHHIFNKDLIDALNPNAYLINIARGSIIDEQYLVEALERKAFKGAALDVFEKEPLPSDSRLWQLDNVVLTSHNCWISEMRNERRFDTIYKNLKRYIEEAPLLNVVDLDKGY